MCSGDDDAPGLLQEQFAKDVRKRAIWQVALHESLRFFVDGAHDISDDDQIGFMIEVLGLETFHHRDAQLGEVVTHRWVDTCV